MNLSWGNNVVCCRAPLFGEPFRACTGRTLEDTMSFVDTTLSRKLFYVAVSFLFQSLQFSALCALVNAQRDLYIGFATLRDLKTLGGMYGDVDLRTAINNGLVQGHRLQVSGRGFQTTGGFCPKGYSRDIPLPSMLETVDSPWEARKAVREQLMNGTDWIKIYAAYEFTFAA